MNESRPCGDFKDLGALIQKQAVGLGNVSVIGGFEFVPQEETLFADLKLHPNDKGFEYYVENLSKHMKIY